MDQTVRTSLGRYSLPKDHRFLATRSAPPGHDPHLAAPWELSDVPPAGELTALLRDYRAGDREAFDRLLALVYPDLRRIARAHLRRSMKAQTLETNGLVHEAWLRLVDQTHADWRDRAHFLAVAARAMRHIVIDYARRRGAVKRGGGMRPVDLDDARLGVPDQAEWLVTLDRILSRLGAHDPRLVQVVECRFFAGLTEAETAEALGVSLRTAQRDWLRARAWLREELRAHTARSQPHITPRRPGWLDAEP
jgi:RNA polymerase sigma-70 factor, ECF subfamily